MRRLILLLAVLVPSCAMVTPREQGATITPGSRVDLAIRSFVEVSATIGPQAVKECQRRTQNTDCNFHITVDPDPRAAPNAFQSIDDKGRPVITFTAGMILSVENRDEMAFVMSHEAAHHILGHLGQQAKNAEFGSGAFEALARRTGVSGKKAVERAQKLGAVLGATEDAKLFELEADELGTVIAYNAGYNPQIGAAFFERLPEPGNRFLVTHPPNAARRDVVETTYAKLKARK